MQKTLATLNRSVVVIRSSLVLSCLASACLLNRLFIAIKYYDHVFKLFIFNLVLGNLTASQHMGVSLKQSLQRMIIPRL